MLKFSLKILFCLALFQSAQDIYEKRKDPEPDPDPHLWLWIRIRIWEAQKHADPADRIPDTAKKVNKHLLGPFYLWPTVNTAKNLYILKLKTF